MNRLKNSVISSLPSFWRDSFKDKSLVSSIGYAVASIGSEVYTRAMATVPAMSIVDCPISYRPERYTLSLRASGLVPLDNGRWAYSLDTGLEYLGVLRSKSPSGEYPLEVGVDFELVGKEDIEDLGLYTEIATRPKVIVFSDNPFSWGESGRPIPNSIEYNSIVEAPYLLRRPESPNDAYLSIHDGLTIYVANSSGYCKCIVAHVQDDFSDGLEPGLYLYISTPAPYEGHVKVALDPNDLQSELHLMNLQSSVIPMEDTEITLMAISPVMDRRYLWNLYGSTMGYERSSSSESFRFELLGRHLLSAGKFSRKNILAAISYMLGLPVVYGIDEVVTSIDYLSDGSSVITTSSSRLVLDAAYAINPEIVDHALIVEGVDNASASRKAEPVEEPTSVASTYDIYDVGSEGDEWWKTDRLVLPVELVPYPTDVRRVVGDGTVEDNKVGNGLQDARVGDYTVVIGDLTREKLSHAVTRDFYLDKIVVISKPDTYIGALLTEAMLDYIRDATPADMALLVHEV